MFFPLAGEERIAPGDDFPLHYHIRRQLQTGVGKIPDQAHTARHQFICHFLGAFRRYADDRHFHLGSSNRRPQIPDIFDRSAVEFCTDDLYHSGLVDDILSIRTYYEQQWLDRGLNIKYLKFRLPQEGALEEPDVEIELDDYRSYNRSKRSSLETSK